MDLLVYNEAEDAFRSGKVFVLTEKGLVPIDEASFGQKSFLKWVVICKKEKTWPAELQPYIDKVKAEIAAEEKPKEA